MASDTRMDWRVRAACRAHVDPDAWIVRRSALSPENRAALAICGTCPVLSDCRSWYDSLEPAMRESVIAGGVRWSNTGTPVVNGDRGGVWTILCHRCGTSFVANWAHARYCCRDCYLAARRERLRQARLVRRKVAA